MALDYLFKYYHCCCCTSLKYLFLQFLYVISFYCSSSWLKIIKWPKKHSDVLRRKWQIRKYKNLLKQTNPHHLTLKKDSCCLKIDIFCWELAKEIVVKHLPTLFHILSGSLRTIANMMMFVCK